ncbi:uncharacterized protein LOC106643747 isoform X1 [Copidosoma floridanum]|uniref:uncharacterized protein LOC106643747 isoform X1 n=1 Tax=Copidosoma floridanum TaxID=29053 RepID=UPI0006C9D628|nr:uncharacterized protein LOC106643747 isoform X1 [Copidosoma floridanum]
MAAKLTYVCLTLLLLIGTQLATSKSVDERNLAPSKRQAAKQESPEAEATTQAPEDDEATTDVEDTTTTTTPAPPPTKKATKPRRRQPASTTAAPTTPAEEEDEEPTTVKPLGKPTKRPKKPITTTAPSVLVRLNPGDEEEEAPTPKPVIVDFLPPMLPFNPPPQGYFPPVDPGFNPWRLNTPTPTPGAPYDYPHPPGPAFSAGTSGAGGAFAGSFASASAGGTGGTVSTSIGGGATPGDGVQQSSSSYSSSGGPGAFAGVNSRGAFPEDDESVGIDVNGPVASAGVPTYVAGPNYGSVSGPGYSAGAAYGANPYANNVSPYGPNPYALQAIFEQYFAALQAQIQAQIQAQQQAGGTFAAGGAVITNGQGAADPNARVYVNTHSSQDSASDSTSVDSRSGLGGSKSTVVARPALSSNNDTNDNTRIWDQSNRVDGNFGAGPYGGLANSYASPYGGLAGSPSVGPQGAFASGSIGPQGGFQSAQVYPAAPGISSRFGESVPAPSGNNYGVFSSSSSSSSVGPDGKQNSKKTATVAVNDNGKISVKTVHDP